MFPAWCFRQRTCMSQGFVHGVLNETWTHSCLHFERFSVGYGFLWRSLLYFSKGVFTLVCFTPHLLLIFDTVCVYVLEWFRISLRVSFFSVYVWMCVLRYIYIYIYIYVYIVKLKVKLATIVEGDPKAPFSIATTPRCRGGRYSIPRIAPLYPWTVPYNAEC